MVRGRPKAVLQLDAEERRTLEAYTRRRKIAQQLALRARIVLLCAAGMNNQQVASRLGLHEVTAGKWRAMLSQRWLKRGTHRSTRALEQAICDYLDRSNSDPKAFAWTKSADLILESIARFCQCTLLVHAPNILERTSGSGH